MNPTLKNILAVFLGLIAGSILNMAIIMLSGRIIPTPQGADITTVEGLKASIHLFKPINFLMPFLAHALGTLFGAFVAVKIAVSNYMRVGMAVAIFFLIGGIANVMMLPSPMWFNVVDLIGAYIPMAYLGVKMGAKSLVQA